VSGVSPYTCTAADLIHAIPYVFPYTPYDTQINASCDVTGMMIGNTFTLDHAFLCADTMTYLSGCAEPKSYVDMDVACGEFEARACQCGGNTQNSYQTIMDLAGPACP
jgi:hypothetical protein